MRKCPRKRRDSSEHTDTDTDTDTGEQRRGRAPRGETRRSEKGRARLKTRKRPQMMVMMAPVAFCALKTKNGAAIAVRDGGHDMGERIQLRGRPRAHRRPPVPIGDAHGLRLIRGDPGRHRASAAAERLIMCQSGLHNLYHHVTKRNPSSLLLPPLFPSPRRRLCERVRCRWTDHDGGRPSTRRTLRTSTGS